MTTVAYVLLGWLLLAAIGVGLWALMFAPIRAHDRYDVYDDTADEEWLAHADQACAVGDGTDELSQRRAITEARALWWPGGIR